MDADIAIRLALREPERGIDTGEASIAAIYAIKISGTNTRPPLTVYYVFTKELVLVVGLKVTSTTCD